jgi:hypothetical protein
MTDKRSKKDVQTKAEAKEEMALLFGGRALGSKEAKRLRAAPNRGERTGAAQAYFERWGVPQDPELLCKFVQQKDTDLVQSALERMLDIVAHAKPAELALMRSTLKSASLTMTRAEARRTAKAVLEALGD